MRAQAEGSEAFPFRDHFPGDSLALGFIAPRNRIMNKTIFHGAALVVAVAGWLYCEQVASAQKDAADAIDVQTRGPVHEAFAQPTDAPAQPDLIVPKKPPDPIPEEPPDQKPEGEVQWIPGYWAWDADKNNFLWVSGFWRTPPPDRKWVPGYWTQVEGGWQWVPGFWAPSNQSDIPYQIGRAHV